MTLLTIRLLFPYKINDISLTIGLLHSHARTRTHTTFVDNHNGFVVFLYLFRPVSKLCGHSPARGVSHHVQDPSKSDHKSQWVATGFDPMSVILSWTFEL